MRTALVPLADGFEELEAVSVIDVLRRGGVKVTTAAIGDSLEVTGANGVTVKADAFFADAEKSEYDVIVLPSGGPGTERLKASEPLAGRLRRQKEERRLLAAICAAPTVLVEAGVLDEGVHVTCYPTCQMELDRPWSPASVVSDGGIITSQAPGTALLFALVVLQHLCGDVIARKVARGMVTDVLE
jgi:4-methyl-5(b-hydroxyethyl)-thiazole monophosphate biosynthesis